MPFSFSRAAQPEAQKPTLLAFSTTSYQQFHWTPTHQSPKGLFDLVWLSLPQPSLTPTLTVWLLSWLSYILVQRLLNRPLNLWNSMFDCHQAEITVMQFRGHSLPVHQSMSVSWAFYLVPFHQPNPRTRSLSITGHCNVSLPSGVSPWKGKFGRVEGQNTTERGREKALREG